MFIDEQVQGSGELIRRSTKLSWNASIVMKIAQQLELFGTNGRVTMRWFIKHFYPRDSYNKEFGAKNPAKCHTGLNHSPMTKAATP